MHKIAAHTILFFSVIILLLFLALPQTALAFNPSLYYDWNYYQNPQQKVLGVRAFAQEDSSTGSGQEATSSAGPTTPDYHNYSQYTGYLFGIGANLTPDNPLYIVKRIQEPFALILTFDAGVREGVRLAFAGERLSEMEAMAKKGRTDLVNSLANTYNSTMEQVDDNLASLKGQNQDISALLAKTDFETAKHTLVLEEVSLQAPPQAERGVEQALAASEKVVDSIADLAGRPAVPSEMVTRLQALKAQGLLTEEEVAKLIAVSSRVEARNEFRKLAGARVLPEADFKKLDEAARSYFPQGYANIIEIKKFKELRDLETQKPDDATLTQLQGFADTYKPGEIVPPALRRWWVPMVRLEELQSTFRPDLINQDFFRYRPEDQQKYQEIVERVKPRAADIEYVNRLAERDPNIFNDPAYARIKALGDRFGSVERTDFTPPQAQACGRDNHWVAVPFMPQGGYCVPNIVYAPLSGGGQAANTSPCPPGYHRNDPLSACLPDNPYGPGAGPTITRAFSTSCGIGYKWIPLPQSGGYCAPESPEIGGGGYPGPFAPPTYCPSNQVFREGKCETYNPLPAEGCPQGQWWNGQKCLAPKDCGSGQYQDSNGDCKATTEQYRLYESQCAGRPIPAEGCGAGYWDTGTCSCRYGYATPSGGGGGIGSCSAPSAGCSGGTTWDTGTCTCKPSCPANTAWNGSYCMQNSNSGGTSSSGSCGPGYYWTGSYCASSTGTGGYQTPSYPTPSGTYPTPSGTYQTPYYGTPSGSYPTPYYGTPSGSYPTPSYGTPSESYGTPSYGTPSPYGTPEYGSPSYGSPSTYGTPSYGTPQ